MNTAWRFLAPTSSLPDQHLHSHSTPQSLPSNALLLYLVPPSTAVLALSLHAHKDLLVLTPFAFTSEPQRPNRTRSDDAQGKVCPVLMRTLHCPGLVRIEFVM